MNYSGEYVLLGNTGLRVSRIALGCGFRGLYTIDEAENLISYAMDHGINFLDCSNVYRLRGGDQAEWALGKAIRGKRDSVVISTKYGAPLETENGTKTSGASAANMIRSVEDSLRRLKTDYIDVYLLHWHDTSVPLEEVVNAFNMLVNDGKIRFFGFCNHDVDAMKATSAYIKENGLLDLSVIQNPYNLLNRSMEEEYLPWTKANSYGVMTYSPLAAGLLGGQLAFGKKPPEKSTWSYNPVYREYLDYLMKGKVKDVIDAVQTIADRYGVSSATVATSWILTHDAVTCCLAGADSEAELDDSLVASGFVLPEEDRAYLDSLSDGMKETLTHPEVAKKLAAIKA